MRCLLDNKSVLFRSSILQINCSRHLNWGFPEKIPSSGANYTALSCLHAIEEQWRKSSAIAGHQENSEFINGCDIPMPSNRESMAGGGQVSPFSCLCAQQSFSWVLQTESNTGPLTDLWLNIAHCGSGYELVSQEETKTWGIHHWAGCVLDPTEDRGWAAAHLITAQAITGPSDSVIYLWEERGVKDHKDLYSTSGTAVYYRRSPSPW